VKSSLKKKLDRTFSKYIRQKHAKNGLVRCITCSKLEPWEDCDAGHYVSRQHLSTRWSEKNVYPQCRACNRFHEGRKDEFALALIRLHGEGILDELNKDKWTPIKIDDLQAQEMIKHYEPIQMD